MKAIHLRAIGPALSALLVLAAAGAEAQQLPTGGYRSPPPRHHGGRHGLHGGIFVIEREVPVIIEREVVRDRPAEPVAAPEPPREPYVLGRSYSSLPGGCLKMIDNGISYYSCSGEWYRQVRAGSGAQYKAVAQP